MYEGGGKKKERIRPICEENEGPGYTFIDKETEPAVEEGEKKRLSRRKKKKGIFLSAPRGNTQEKRQEGKRGGRKPSLLGKGRGFVLKKTGKKQAPGKKEEPA